MTYTMTSSSISVQVKAIIIIFTIIITFFHYQYHHHYHCHHHNIMIYRRVPMFEMNQLHLASHIEIYAHAYYGTHYIKHI